MSKLSQNDTNAVRIAHWPKPTTPHSVLPLGPLKLNPKTLTQTQIWLRLRLWLGLGLGLSVHVVGLAFGGIVSASKNTNQLTESRIAKFRGNFTIKRAHNKKWLKIIQITKKKKKKEMNKTNLGKS